MSDAQYDDPNWSALKETPLDQVAGRVGAVRAWTPPGPVAFDFLQSDSFVRLIAGPYGSGKTGALVVDPFVKAARQPKCRDGVRRHKHVFVRDTYPNLYTNLLETYEEWVPRELGAWRGGENRPFRHDIKIRDEYGLIELTIEGTAIGERDPEKVLDGYQPTGVGLNGITGLDEAVIEYFLGRMGRFPAKQLLPEGVDSWTGIAADFNKPDAEHYLYRWCNEYADPNNEKSRELAAAAGLPEGALLVEFFDQPGGRDPEAENVQNLQPGYYDRMAALWPAWKTRRLVDNKWGANRDGKPVYEDEWDEQRHAPLAGVQPVPGVDIGIGVDGGSTLNPAAVIGQRDHEGQWRILAEFVPGKGTGATRFATHLRDYITEHLKGFRFYGFGDPAAFGGNDKEHGEQSWIDTIEAILGISFEPAPTNAEQTRIDAVKQALDRRVTGNRAGLVVDRTRCPTLKKGFDAGYQYRLTKVAGKETPENHPAKTGPAGAYSHPHDALQYLVLGREGLHAVTARAGGGVGASSAHQMEAAPQRDWSPLDI